MPPKEENGSLERMREKLYQTNSAPAPIRTPLSVGQAPVARSWQQAPTKTFGNSGKPPLPLPVKFFIAACVFFLITGIIAGAFILFGGRSISAEYVDILIVNDHTTAASGDTIPLTITVQNRNPVAIVVKDLSINFPDGTRDPADPQKALSHVSIPIGEIAPGSGVTKTVEAVYFGGENQVLTVPIRIEYTTQGSNATFQKEKDDTFTITTSPLSMTATSVTEITSGQQMTFSLSVRANATDPLSNVAIRAEYPYGFTATSASIPGRNGNTFFWIGKLAPGEERRFTVTGTVTGQNDDKRVFHWSAGTAESAESAGLAIAYATAQSELSITKPFIDVALSIGGLSADKLFVVAGQGTQATLTWRNTLTAPILDGQVTVKLSGAALDPTKVSSSNGFYQSSNSSILFDRDTSNGLADLAPGDSGTGSFSFAAKESNDLSTLQDPVITFTVSVAGRRVGQGGVPENVTSTLTRTVKVATDLTLASKAVRTVGPFENSGPWPPTPGKETTYTIMLTADNTVSATAGTVVSMTLPSYVTFTNFTNPSGAVTYASATRTVTWNIGNLGAHTKREAAFQVSLLPSLSQLGSNPTLVSAQKISGTDRFTQTEVGMTAAALTTDTREDPAYQVSDGPVQ